MVGLLISAVVILCAWKSIVSSTRPPQNYEPPLTAAEIQRQHKESEKAQREAERREKQLARDRQAEARRIERERRQEAEKQQAAADVDFYTARIDSLYALLWEADAALEAAQRTVDHDEAMNASGGAVIAEKVANKHKAERYKLARRVMQLEGSIRAAEARLNKARITADN